MSTNIASPDVPLNPHVLSGGMSIPLPRTTPSVSLHSAVPDSQLQLPLPQMTPSVSLHSVVPNSQLQLQIAVPDFQLQLKLALKDRTTDGAFGRVVFEAIVDQQVTAIIAITGKLNSAEDEVQMEHVSISMERARETARADFVYSSLMSMFALADHVYLQIPEAQLDLNLKFDTPLLNVSQLLRQRQIAYRIMVIEQATDNEFTLPNDISAEQVEGIALIYHAIVQRSFAWPIETVRVFYPAINDLLNQLTVANQFDSVMFGPTPRYVMLFGQQIFLGAESLLVENKVIENFDYVKRELAQNDGHKIEVVVRSLTGQGRYDFPSAPYLPSAPWNSTIQSLVNLEQQLDARIVEHYHALAAATLTGLTEEEKVEVTTRPELGEAFLIEDSTRENT